MKKLTLYIATLISICFLAVSCKKQITVPLDQGKSQLAVSAFINNKRTPQVIILSATSPYLNNAPCPAATGATVSLKDSKGNTHSFSDVAGNGYYTWTPTPGDTLVHVNYDYTLSINYNGVNYQAQSHANPVPKIDSMHYELGKSFNPNASKSYLVSFYATDLPGRTDFYWIQGFKGDSLIHPQEITISIDGSMGGSAGNGLPFIYPIRTSINPSFSGGYLPGDTCTVELNSINADTYFYFNEVNTAVQNTGLFSKPLANPITNIKNTTPNSTSTAVGYFNVAMTAVKGIRVK